MDGRQPWMKEIYSEPFGDPPTHPSDSATPSLLWTPLQLGGSLSGDRHRELNALKWEFEENRIGVWRRSRADPHFAYFYMNNTVITNQRKEGGGTGLGNDENGRGTRWEKQCLRKVYDRVGVRTGRDKDTLDMVLHVRGMRGWMIGYMFGMARREQWSDRTELMFGNNWATWRWKIDGRNDEFLGIMDMGKFVTISGFRVHWSLERKLIFLSISCLRTVSAFTWEQ